jgi:hypothetical protein
VSSPSIIDVDAEPMLNHHDQVAVNPFVGSVAAEWRPMYTHERMQMSKPAPNQGIQEPSPKSSFLYNRALEFEAMARTLRQQARQEEAPVPPHNNGIILNAKRSNLPGHSAPNDAAYDSTPNHGLPSFRLRRGVPHGCIPPYEMQSPGVCHANKRLSVVAMKMVVFKWQTFPILSPRGEN